MTTQLASSATKPRIGVSLCLLGEQVRFDGGHKRDQYLMGTLADYVDWVPCCPEVEAGMGIPREPIRLEEREGAVRLVGTRSAEDWTERMEQYALRRCRQLASANLAGYVLKRASPSCGMERVKVYRGSRASKDGVGLFARTLMEVMPLLPLEEEGRLNDAPLRESFIERVFAYQRWQELCAERKAASRLVAFHARHKYLLMAHSEVHARRLGRLVSQLKARPLAEIYADYGACFMAGLAVRATRKKHTNVLQHLYGFFSDELDERQRNGVLAAIGDYHRGLVPLVAPLTLIRHYIDVLDVEWARDQVYLQPHPRELMLRNHA